MKSKIKFFVVLFLISLGGINSQTANTNANSSTKKIFTYLKNLGNENSKKLISGQMANSFLSPSVSFDSSAKKIFNKTGKWVGLLGFDYQRSALGFPSQIKECNKVIIDYFKKGGLVTVMSSFSNPWNNSGSQNDTTSRSNLLEIITPGTSAYQKFHIQLDSVSKGFKELKDSNVTVLYRPFHEQNAVWFWWGSYSNTKPTKEEWTSVWKHIFNYFTIQKGLDNILWVFSPSAKPNTVASTFKPDDYYYPGTNYVDIVGVDVYSDSLSIPYYNSLISFDKPFALCEFGMGTEKSKTANSFDYRMLLSQIKNKFPKIVYWMSWNDFTGSKGNTYYGLTNQSFVNELLKDPWVINREDIKWNIPTKILEKDLPCGYGLYQNYPNPFNPQTVINYQISASSHVSLKVYDVLGREVVTLVDEIKEPGSYSSPFVIHSSFSSGVYFYRLRAGGFVQTNRMNVLK